MSGKLLFSPPQLLYQHVIQRSRWLYGPHSDRCHLSMTSRSTQLNWMAGGQSAVAFHTCWSTETSKLYASNFPCFWRRDVRAWLALIVYQKYFTNSAERLSLWWTECLMTSYATQLSSMAGSQWTTGFHDHYRLQKSVLVYGSVWCAVAKTWRQRQLALIRVPTEFISSLSVTTSTVNHSRQLTLSTTCEDVN